MVQQPVIQLVQELTMTAVVERHECTDLKKQNKKRSKNQRVPGLVWIHFSFLSSLKVSLCLSHKSGERSVRSFNQHTVVLKLISQWQRFISPLKSAGERRPSFREQTHHRHLEERLERKEIMYSNRTNSAGHLAICKVVLRYQWDMLALGHHSYIQGTWSITNQYMLE